MIDSDAAHLALRTRARSLVVCTTGLVTLSATATGYARDAGSFRTDGIYRGMEITPSGFGSNPVDVVTDVQDLTITTLNARAVEGPLANRAIAVTLPSQRAWEDIDFTPTPGVPYIEEDWVPATSTVSSATAQSGFGEETGLYLLKWYAPQFAGGSGLRRSIDALKALFASGTTFAVGAGVLRIRSDQGPYAGQLLQVGKGWSVITLTIPWRAESLNTIAA